MLLEQGPVTLDAAMMAVAEEIEQMLDRFLPLTDCPERRLHEAMRYASLTGGKRLRPFLVVESASLFDVSRQCAMRVGAALEMVHCYSLIHDDMPAMDNSDLRRGKPTTHIKFDEATAILAGDALLTRAFEIVADSSTHADPAVRIDLVRELAIASGANGMCGGQMLDLIAEGRGALAPAPLDISSIARLQRLKTGALIAFACTAGAILGRASLPLRHRLMAYAHDLGLAFQVVDDVLDATGNEAALGKKVRQDSKADKATFVSVMGLERAQAQAKLLANQAVQHLDNFGTKANFLRATAQFVITRQY